ncbi:MAG TPA: glycoside hydrolase family 3 C-terminal domain-containing protein [Phycisphaerales bacterium]|nr:glycoside hydrolase family 3 C-terminal domain-containing protein [Phycisphaerales bacterium]
MLITALALTIVHLALAQAPPAGRGSDAPAVEVFRDPSRSPDERAADLLGRLTLGEKISQLVNDSPAIERLGIPAYNWWSECLHGVARAGRATVFPQTIGLGATFDDDLVKQIAAAIADEARAKHNAAIAANGGNSPQYSGLTFWTPNINIFRDPRWGRGQETYGEDPFLTGVLGAAFVRGLQGDDPNHIKAAACAKHFAVHSGPEPLRHSFDAVVSPMDLRETYLPAFHDLVKAGVAGVMCAYNRLDGEPCCGNGTLLGDILRKEWGFEGYVVSDCGALYDMYQGHKTSKDAAKAAALAVKTGVNVECGHVYYELPKAVERGLVMEKDIDAALLPGLRVRMRLGLFDPPGSGPYDRIGMDVVDSPAHRALAHRAAVESIVLLKNKDGVLPLKKSIKRLAVVGPNAASVQALLGNYNGLSSSMVTVLEGLIGHSPEGCSVEYTQGCLLNEKTGGSGGAVWMSQGADAVVAVMGITSLLEGEEGDALANTNGGDRKDIGLPANQVEFLKELRRGVHIPIIVVLTGGSPIACPEVHDLADAVLMAWYPGEEGGAAVADVLFGDANPSGKLPVTVPRSLEQLPPFEDYSMSGEKSGKGRTYRYMTDEPLYPFGFGLSYAKFEYQDLRKLVEPAGEQEMGTLEAVVHNSGPVDGDEVVQLYITPPAGTKDAPQASLKAVRRVHVPAGETELASFKVTREMFEVVNGKGERVVLKGEYTVQVGGCSPGSRGLELDATPILSVKIRAE